MESWYERIPLAKRSQNKELPKCKTLGSKKN